jgi:hypothetical protein
MAPPAPPAESMTGNAHPTSDKPKPTSDNAQQNEKAAHFQGR